MRIKKPISLLLALMFFALLQAPVTAAAAMEPPASGTSNKSNKVTLSFVGDVHLGGDFGKSGAIEKLYKKNGASYFFKGVAGIFGQDDLTIVNLETPFTTQSDYQKGKIYTYKADPKVARILGSGGVEMVNVVSNHMQDYKQDGFNESLKVLKKQRIDYFGTNLWNCPSPEVGSVKVEQIVIQEINGIRIGFLGYSGFIWPNQAYKEKVRKDLKLLRDEADFIVVSMHWGGQNTRVIRPKERAIAKFLIDNGADFIYGHHPHVLQKIETYKGKKIAYSLGNFLFNNIDNPRDRLTAILSLTIEKKALPSSVHSVTEDTGALTAANLPGDEPGGHISANYKVIPVSFNGNAAHPYQPQIIKDKKTIEKIKAILGM